MDLKRIGALAVALFVTAGVPSAAYAEETVVEQEYQGSSAAELAVNLIFTKGGQKLINSTIDYINDIKQFRENGSRAGFCDIDGATVYFRSDGTKERGFCVIDGEKYCFDSDGKMLTGMQELNGFTYYFRDDGSAASGWLELDGERYFFNSGGIMKTGMLDIDGSRYSFAEDGKMQTGLVKYGDDFYYFFENGKAYRGWRTVNRNKYYFGKNYAAQKGLVRINGKKCYFNPDTAMQCKGCTVNGITTDGSGAVVGVLLEKEYISQIGYPTGCESASAVMLLRDAGYDTTIDEFIDGALDKSVITKVGNELYGPHPNEYFIGDPRQKTGYGCYAPVITRALNRILEGDLAVNLTGMSLPQLTEYIDRGIPVAIWATINMIESVEGSKWIIYGTDEKFTWKRNEHCLVLVGYDEQYYYLNDPYEGNGLVKFERALVEDRHTYMGSQSVIILQDIGNNKGVSFNSMHRN